jgi:hypothetical protein
LGFSHEEVVDFDIGAHGPISFVCIDVGVTFWAEADNQRFQ